MRIHGKLGIFLSGRTFKMTCSRNLPKKHIINEYVELKAFCKVLDSQVIFMSSLVYRIGRILPYLAKEASQSQKPAAASMLQVCSSLPKPSHVGSPCPPAIPAGILKMLRALVFCSSKDAIHPMAYRAYLERKKAACGACEVKLHSVVWIPKPEMSGKFVERILSFLPNSFRMVFFSRYPRARFSRSPKNKKKKMSKRCQKSPWYLNKSIIYKVIHGSPRPNKEWSLGWSM